MTTPLPEALVHALAHSQAQVFCHEIVMDAIDLSMALDRHVLLYGHEGLFVLETDVGSWRLPPTRAAWVPAGTVVTATTIRQVRCTSLFFHEGFGGPVAPELCVFHASPVVREMIRHARRFTPDQAGLDPARERFLLTLLDLCREQARQGTLFSLPKARSVELDRALAYTRAHLDQPVRLDDAARHGAMSPRTLMRRLQGEIHMTFGQYLRAARMLRAMEHLAEGRTVSETAHAVGYATPSAFTTAFGRFAAMTPSDYRAQVEAGEPDGTSPSGSM